MTEWWKLSEVQEETYIMLTDVEPTNDLLRKTQNVKKWRLVACRRLTRKKKCRVQTVMMVPEMVLMSGIKELLALPCVA